MLPAWTAFKLVEVAIRIIVVIGYYNIYVGSVNLGSQIPFI